MPAASIPAPAPSAPSRPAPRKLLLDGQWRESARVLKVVSPWTGGVVTEVFEATAEEAQAAGEAARRVFPALRGLTAAQRSEGLRQVAEGLARRGEELAAVIRDEVGKPMWLSRGEAQRAVRTFSLAAEEARRLPGEVVYPDSEPQGAGLVGRVQHFPSGPVLGIGPFNFPLNLIAHKAAPALAAGCPVVLKPPPQGPSAALILGEVFLESGLPAAALQVLPGGVETGRALCAGEAFAAVSFTGSARVGWAIKKNARPRQKVLLELGGNAAAIVDESADLEAAAKAVSEAGYVYAGQVCISTQRVLVHRRVAGAFEELLARRILTGVQVSGDPADEEAFVGPLIDAEAAQRIESWVQSARARGGRALVEGARRGERLISPWLLKDVPADEPVACEEVFGPVVVTQEFGTMEEAIALVNASRYGLQASVFTASLRHAELAYREIACGAVLVNVPTTFRLDAALYGGVKESGFGREGPREVVRAFTEPKLLIVKP
jgi:glyceraldehyde-3-phosphate dehydrogenase (NADP+)